MKKDEEELSYATNKRDIQKTKIVFIGDQYVGKTSIINRFIKDTFDNSHNPTIGIDFVSKNISLNGKMMRLQLWDTAGQQRFRSLIPSYLRDSQAAFIIYDLTNEESFNNVTKWVDFVKEHRGEDVLIFAIANKLDLKQNRAVTVDVEREAFKEMGITHWQVSAKSGENIDKMFQQACAKLLEIPPDTQLTPLQIHQSKVLLPKNDVPLEEQRPTKNNLEKGRGQKLTQNSRQIKQKGCC